MDGGATIDDFLKLDFRLGRVLTAEPNPKARKPAYVMTIDFGPEIGVRTSSAQVTERYRPEDLIGRQVVGVVNFPPRRIAGVKSEALVVGFSDADGAVVLIGPDQPVAEGARLH